MGKRFWLCVLIAFVLAGHLGFDAYSLHQQSLKQESGAYRVLDHKRLTERVILVVVDSWALRLMEDPSRMPLLFERQKQGASGVLWAPRQTGTMHGVLALSTGVSPSGLAAIGLISTSAHTGWTIFDDVVAQGETASFHGGPRWVYLFGDRGTNNFRETGHGPLFREEDMEGLAHAQQAQLSAKPPMLSVLHITETDVAAHQYGTERPEYLSVIRHWDGALDGFLARVLRPGTTVIITADHGNDLNGNHGGSDAIYRRVPVIMLGQGIVPGARIQMNATDMPATIAALLGIRAPSSATALPAVEALALSPAERGQALLAAYTESFLNKPDLAADRPDLVAQARAALPRPGQSAADFMPQLRSTFAVLEEQAGATRSINPVDWFFVGLTFLLAAVMGLMAWQRPAAEQTAGKLGGQAGGYLHAVWQRYSAWILAFFVIEVIFGARIVYAADIRAAIKARGPALWSALALGLAAAALLAAWLWRHRTQALSIWRDQQRLFLVMAYVLTTVVYPINMAGMMTGVLIVAWLWDRDWPAKVRWFWLACFAAYLLSGVPLWTALGETAGRRYLVGLPIAAGAVLALAWQSRVWSKVPLNVSQWASLAGIGLGLALFPFSALSWSDIADPTQLAVTTVAVLAAMAGAVRFWGLDPRLGLNLLPTLLFWWWANELAWGLYAALGAGAVLTAWACAANWGQERVYAAVLVALTCVLMTLSTPEHTLSLLAFAAVVALFFQWRPKAHQRGVSLVMAGVMLVAARYGLFDLYGFVDSPAAAYLLKHLDLSAAYLGDATRSIGGAAFMVVLKLWLAGVLLVLIPATFRHWRHQLDDVMAMVAVFLLIQVGQATVRASLAVGALSYQYDVAEFSALVHTGLLVFGMLAYWAIRERRWLGQTVADRAVVSVR